MKIYKNKNHTIYNGDVFECFSKIKDKSIDLIFADPPYNIGKDFDGLIDKKNEQDFLVWSYKWIDEVYRVLKENGSFYLMNSTQSMPFLDLYCRKYFNVISRIVWSYDSSSVQSKSSFGSQWEPILFMSKGKKYKFNSKDIEVEAKTGAQRKLIDYSKTQPRPYNNKKIPGNLWNFNRIRYLQEEYENHPTQKPEVLLERIIRVSSNKNDLILDPFSGSFTTSAVAKKNLRKSIGFEINEGYIKIGLRRLDIKSHFSSKELEKIKKRKTKNKSKSDHNQNEKLI
jgi:site-specific DNA-methyltransferase (adenine-specific)/adenine-specific DNA-methyltransferase